MREEPTSHGQTSYGQPGEAVTAKPTVAPVVVCRAAWAVVMTRRRRR